MQNTAQTLKLLTNYTFFCTLKYHYGKSKMDINFHYQQVITTTQLYNQRSVSLKLIRVR